MFCLIFPWQQAAHGKLCSSSPLWQHSKHAKLCSASLSQHFTFLAAGQPCKAMFCFTFLAAGEACKAVSCFTPGLTVETFESSGHAAARALINSVPQRYRTAGWFSKRYTLLIMRAANARVYYPDMHLDISLSGAGLTDWVTD